MCGCKANSNYTGKHKKVQPLKNVRKVTSEPVMTVIDDGDSGLKIVVGEIIESNISNNVQLHQK